MKTLRKPGRFALIASLVVALAGAWTGATFSAFTSPQGSSGNIVTAAPDWKGPALTGGGGKASGPLGYIRQGDTVYLFLNVTDTGNPASGVATVTASVDVPGYGTMTMPMTPGSYTVRGQLQLPKRGPDDAAGLCRADADGRGHRDRQRRQHHEPELPGRRGQHALPPAPRSPTTNGGGTQSDLQPNDTMSLTFSQAMDPIQLLAQLGWPARSGITVRLDNNAAVGGNDRLSFYNVSALGTINLGRADYMTANRTFNNSTMVMSGNTITVTLGTASGAGTTAGGYGTMSWMPDNGATDLAGNAAATTNAVETGAARPRLLDDQRHGAAVHGPGGSGHVRGALRAEEDDRRGDLLLGCPSAQGRPAGGCSPAPPPCVEPVRAATWAARPSWSSQAPVATGPGVTALTSTPLAAHGRRTSATARAGQPW